LLAEQAFASEVSVVLEDFSEHGTQQNFFSTCPPPIFVIHSQHSKMSKWLPETSDLFKRSK
jgi:hypothetical protein